MYSERERFTSNSTGNRKPKCNDISQLKNTRRDGKGREGKGKGSWRTVVCLLKSGSLGVTSCDTVHWAFHGSEFNLCLAWVPPQRHFVTVSSVYLKRPNESSLFFFFSLWLNCVRVCVCVWKREIPFWAASLPFINKRCSLQTNRQGAGPGSGSGYGYGVGAKPGSTTVTGLGSRMGFCCFAFDPEKWKYNKKMLPPFVSEIFSYLSNCFFFFFLVFILETKWGNGECRLDAFLNSGRSALVSTRRQSINLSANTPPSPLSPSSRLPL